MPTSQDFFGPITGLFRVFLGSFPTPSTLLGRGVGVFIPDVSNILNNLAWLYEKLGKKKEAAEFLERANGMTSRRSIYEKQILLVPRQ